MPCGIRLESNINYSNYINTIALYTILYILYIYIRHIIKYGIYGDVVVHSVTAR